jgi:hypothetical protein
MLEHYDDIYVYSIHLEKTLKSSIVLSFVLNGRALKFADEDRKSDQTT